VAAPGYACVEGTCSCGADECRIHTESRCGPAPGSVARDILAMAVGYQIGPVGASKVAGACLGGSGNHFSTGYKRQGAAVGGLGGAHWNNERHSAPRPWLAHLVFCFCFL
jgi:hypothetical protein